MTTINTVMDLHRILVEHPEWRDELRRILLTDELLRLPQVMAEFIETTNRRSEETDQRFDSVDQRFDSMDQRFDSVDQRFDSMEHAQSVHSRHISDMKGRFIEMNAERAGMAIACEMGLREARILTFREVEAIAEEAIRSGKAEGIARNDMRSFRMADMLMEATNKQGQVCYIAGELSYTADERDTGRAIRNAGYLTRFLDSPAYPVVAGVFQDDRVEELLTESVEQVYGGAGEKRALWFQMDE